MTSTQQYKQFTIELYETGVKITRPAPKSKAGIKVAAWYKFLTDTQRDEYLIKWKNQQDTIESERTRKANEKTIAKQSGHPFKEGDIFVDSWGYDQTNIDFYQVVKVSASSVTIREVAQNKTATLWCQGVATPIRDKFIGEPILKRCQFATWDTPEKWYLRSNHGWMTKYKEGEKHSYSSYA